MQDQLGASERPGDVLPAVRRWHGELHLRATDRDGYDGDKWRPALCDLHASNVAGPCGDDEQLHAEQIASLAVVMKIAVGADYPKMRLVCHRSRGEADEGKQHDCEKRSFHG